MMNCLNENEPNSSTLICIHDNKSSSDHPTKRSIVHDVLNSLGYYGFNTIVVIPSIIVAAIVALPLLVAAFVVTRFLQFIYGCGYVYDKGTKLKVFIKLKLFIRTWIYIDTLCLMIVFVILCGVGHGLPFLGLKGVHILGYTIMHWIETYFIIFCISTISYLFSIVCKRFMMFCIPLDYHTFKCGSYVVSDTVHEIIDCFILLLFAEHMVMMRFPFLKKYKILEFYHFHSLFDVLVLLLVSHDLIGLSIHMLVRWLHDIVTYPGENKNSFRYLIWTKFWGRKTLVYWANGLKPSIMFTCSSLMLLLTWVLYFRNQPEKHEHESSKAKKILNFGTWSTLCLFIFSILWLIKTCLLLVLENRMVYSRFGSKISQGGKQLYFLGVIGRFKHDFLKLQYDKDKSTTSTPTHHQDTHDDHNGGFLEGCKHVCNLNSDISDLTKRTGASILTWSIFPLFLIGEEKRYQLQTDPEDTPKELETNQVDYVKKLSVQRKKRAKAELLTQHRDPNTVTLYDLQKIVQHFLAAKKYLLQDDYISDILKILRLQGDDGTGPIDESLKKLIEKGDVKKDGAILLDCWEYFRNDVVDPSFETKLDDKPTYDHITEDKLKAWLERARKQCVFLANTLSSAKGIVECLDRIMSAVLIVVALILWLLLTRLTTKDLIVLVGSPVIALNFMFGETSKTFFQGIVFLYTVHPFDVGDLCVIDGNMLEVITIGVWKTTFSRVETLEEVIYPNSDLVNKYIINHKTDFDWNDRVELYVSSTESEKIKSLKKKIQQELKKGDKYESTPGGIIEVIGNAENKIKIVVDFRHKSSHQKKSMTYFECLREKRKLRSEFVQKFVVVDDFQEIEIEEASH